jgi:uncharacterized OB-fold protein
MTDRTIVELQLPVCGDCHRAHWPPMEHCPHCLGGEVRMTPHLAAGTLLAATGLHHSLDEAFRDRMPWGVGLVFLDTGVTLLVDRSDLRESSVRRVIVENAK